VLAFPAGGFPADPTSERVWIEPKTAGVARNGEREI
jgi:hypothetical protein